VKPAQTVFGVLNASPAQQDAQNATKGLLELVFVSALRFHKELLRPAIVKTASAPETLALALPVGPRLLAQITPNATPVPMVSSWTAVEIASLVGHDAAPVLPHLAHARNATRV